MITVKERYYARSEGEMTTAKRYTIVECHNDDEVWFKMKEVAHGEYVLYSDYKELEQKLKDSELRRADLPRTLIKSTSKVQELEHEKVELIKMLKDVLGYAGQDEFVEACHKASNLLNKHKDKPDAL